MGKSLSTEPSIHPSFGVGSQGTSFPVARSFAFKDAAEKMKGTEQEAQLEYGQNIFSEIQSDADLHSGPDHDIRGRDVVE